MGEENFFDKDKKIMQKNESSDSSAVEIKPVDKVAEVDAGNEVYEKQKAGSHKGHLKGWQWRESKRAMEKKERAKSKYFKPKDENRDFVKARESFIIPAEKREGIQYGTVLGLTRGRIKVLFENKYYDCTIDRGLPFELSEILAVGDHVTIKVDKDKYFVDHLIERKSVLSRLRRDSTRWGGDGVKNEQIIAANVDAAVIVVAAKNPPLHPKFIDRYLILIQHGKITPIVCVNKADLGVENEDVLSAYRNAGIRVVETSVETGQGLDELKEAISNKVVVLVGNSGVGKSSLINSIAPQLSLRVGGVGSKTGKGKHTTTSSDMITWAEGSFIIDTPGIRSLGMANITKQDLQLYFSEISEFSNKCKFLDCTHDFEEKCGVKDAVKNGLIDSQRYSSYLKILKEIV